MSKIGQQATSKTIKRTRIFFQPGIGAILAPLHNQGDLDQYLNGDPAMLLEKGDKISVDGCRAEVIERTDDGWLVVDVLMPDGHTRFEKRVRPSEVAWVIRDGKIVSRTFW